MARERCEGNLFDNGLILALWDVESRNYPAQRNKVYTVSHTYLRNTNEVLNLAQGIWHILHFACGYGPKISR